MFQVIIHCKCTTKSTAASLWVKLVVHVCDTRLFIHQTWTSAAGQICVSGGHRAVCGVDNRGGIIYSVTRNEIMHSNFDSIIVFIMQQKRSASATNVTIGSIRYLPNVGYGPTLELFSIFCRFCLYYRWLKHKYGGFDEIMNIFKLLLKVNIENNLNVISIEYFTNK